MRTRSVPARVGLAVAVWLAWWPGQPRPAEASPLEDPTFGGAVFTGVTQPDGSSLFINPAALALATYGWHLQIDGSLQLDQYRVQRRRLLMPDAGFVDGPRVEQTTVSPAWGFTGYNVGRQGAFGFTFGLPAFTLGLPATDKELRVPDVPFNAPMTESFIADEADLGYHVLDGSYRRYVFAALGGALRAGDRLHLGMSVYLVSSALQLSFLRDTALEATDPARGVESSCGAAACGIENPEATERYDLDVATGSKLERQNFAFNAGVMLKVISGWWLGFSYQSPPGVVSTRTLTGDVAVTAAPRDVAAGGSERFTGDAEVIFRVPQRFTLGVRGAVLPGWDLVGSARWQTLSGHQMFDVRMFGGNLAEGAVPEQYPRYRGFGDVLTVELGIEGQESGRVRAGARLRAEQGAVSSQAVAPGQIDGDNYGAVVGAQLRVLQYFLISASYGVSWYPGITVEDSLYDPRDRLACTDSEFDLDVCRAAGEGRAIASAAGSYGRLQHAIRLSLRWDSP